MNEKLALLARFYSNPSRAASDAIDKSSLGFAMLCAVIAFVVWSFAGGRFLPAFVSPVSISGLVATFVVIPIVSILVVAVRDSLGSITIVLQREYVSLLICALLAWSAVYIPFGLLALFWPVVALLAHATFVVLFVFCLRTALGTTLSVAILATLVGWSAAFGFLLAWPIIGNFSYILLSPWLLFILYRYYSPDLRSLGSTASSRQHFRRQLEASMLNPRDADAHYQLGLIYQQRRQYELAEASFRRAVEIHPDEADAQLQLGRILRIQGKHEEARRHIELALKADSGVGRQEGWRDLGAVLLDLGLVQEAVAPLERYTTHRSYDPEGLFYYGVALRKKGRTAEARQAFQQGIEAVQTAPSYRRGQLRKWASDAKAELRTL
ncbi:MAG TPA: tetratricopeptide repeat protein [Bryobacteraceae bacterium]|nr:tetratricopeptide repeat protein [Bryobacteraceae bacterium]